MRRKPPDAIAFGQFKLTTTGKNPLESSSMEEDEVLAARDPYRTLDGHSAVLYGRDEATLVDHVVLFTCENLAAEDPVLIVATQAHRDAFLAALRAAGADTRAAIAGGHLICLDPVATIEEILKNGRIDWRAFDLHVGELVRNLRMRGPLQVYGEMVGILWALGRHELAIDLELHWNRLRKRVDFNLLCAYDIDVFGAEFLVDEIAGIVRTHGQILPCGGPSAA
jgi:MEDS: MEthanogen/methylotroph, DcmR Sensory domain